MDWWQKMGKSDFAILSSNYSAIVDKVTEELKEFNLVQLELLRHHFVPGPRREIPALTSLYRSELEKKQ